MHWRCVVITSCRIVADPDLQYTPPQPQVPVLTRDVTELQGSLIILIERQLLKEKTQVTQVSVNLMDESKRLVIAFFYRSNVVVSFLSLTLYGPIPKTCLSQLSHPSHLILTFYP